MGREERPESREEERRRYHKSSTGEQVGGKPGERLRKEGPGGVMAEKPKCLGSCIQLFLLCVGGVRDPNL